MTSSLRSFVLIVCLLSLGRWQAAIAAPAPQLNGTAPIAVKLGQSVETTLGGQHLAAIAAISVPDPQGVTVELVKPEKPSETDAKLKVTASADAAPGDREVRLIGPLGVSQPVRVYVSPYQVVAEKEPNNTFKEPQELPLPATLVGRIDSPGDTDVFRFSGTKGDKLIFDVHATRLGSPLEPVVTIHRDNGRELVPAVEHKSGDPLLIFDVPADGKYLLRVRDLEFRGGGDFDYRITAGKIPYLEALLPMSGRPGQVVDARAIGYNLDGGDKVTVDLSSAAPGSVAVRAKTPLGLSNELPFEVTELPQTIEQEPNDKPESATTVALPTEISGHIDRSGDEDYFKFHLPYRQAVNLEVLAGRFGSPVTPLLQLRDAKGNVIESNDGAPDADARIGRELDAGEYLVSVRDLVFAGGPGNWYRLKIEPALMVPQDFSVRFLPDNPRLHRGGNAALWCEVKRHNGFKGDVTVQLEGLPAGVTSNPVVMGETTSGVFTISANPEAALGSVPVRLRATATIGTQQVTHYAEPEMNGRVVREAYLTVLDPSPFTVEAVAMMTPQRIEQLNGEVRTLAEKITQPNPQLEAAQAQWEKKVLEEPAWTVLEPASLTTEKGTILTSQKDDSVLASGNFPAQDKYTFVAHTDRQAITAIRLEVLAGDGLPNRGPGAAPNGNFVLNEFRLTVRKGDEPPQAVAFSKATADFSQNGWPVAAAIDNNPGTGWAIDPQEGRSHTAIFELAKPLDPDDDSALTFELDHQSVFAQHNIGRFRISITTAEPNTIKLEGATPEPIVALVKVPSEQRTAEQKAQLTAYYRTIDPQTTADRTRLEGLRNFIAPYAQIARLEDALKKQTPQLDAEMALWEQGLSSGTAWTALELGELKSSSGAQLAREPDGSISVSGTNGPVDTYTVSAQTNLRNITAVRLEVLADPRLPAEGPGRAGDGNFVLSGFRVQSAAKVPSTQPATQPSEGPVEFESAKATYEQPNFGIAGSLDDRNDTGWGVGGNTGRPAAATFYAKVPFGSETGSVLAFTLEQLSPQPQHTIGRFRLWVTTNRQPDSALVVPQKIAAILKVAGGGRNEEQKRELASYFRSIAPSLEPVRERLADLKAQVPALPLASRRNRGGAIPVALNRNNFRGDVQVTLEGFAAGREGNKPTPIGKDIKVTPLTLAGDASFGLLTYQVEPGDRELGTRLVVLKTESKVGDETVTEYSPAFPLTVEK